MNKTMHTQKLTALAAALMAVFGYAQAEDDEVKKLITPESSISVGIGNWSNDRPHEGIYDGMRDEGLYGLVDANIIRRDDTTGTWMTFSARNLGLDTREIGASWLHQGVMGLSLDYSRTPRDNPYTFTTGLQGIGSSSLVVSGAGANALPSAQVELGTTRDLTSLGFYRNLMHGLDLKISFKNEDKEGTRQWGRGGAAEFMVEPINSTTRQVEATLSYAGEKLQLSGGYYGSWYQNQNSLVDTTRNGEDAAVLNNHIFLSLPLDNQAHQASFNGGYSFTPSTRGTFKLSYTRATQDDNLPTANIPGLSSPIAPRRIDAEVNTTLAQVGVTSRVSPKLSLLANVRYYDVDDATPQVRVIQATTATGLRCEAPGNCVDNTPLSFRTITSKLEGTYRLPAEFSVTGGVDYSRQDRTVPVGSIATTGAAAGLDTQRYVPFRATLDETTLRLQLRRSLSDTVNGSIAYLYSKRTGSGFSRTEETESDEISPINIADRDRNKLKLVVDWTPIDKLSLQVSAEGSRDNYDHDSSRPYGLDKGTATVFALDTSYAVGENWQLTGWYSYDKTKANQLAQRSPTSNATTTVTAAERDAHLSDRGDSIGLGLRGRPIKKVRIGADLQWTKNKSSYDESINAAGQVLPTVSNAGQPVVTVLAPLPDIENKLTRIKLFLEYAIQKNADIRLDFIHERWRTDDWTWNFANGSPFQYTGAGTSPATFTDGTTVTSPQKQVSSFVGVRYIYRFQ